MKLLLVEDDSRLLTALSTALTRYGFTVTCGRTAAQALALVGQDPDAVLLDVGLPDGDGFAVCRQIRRTSSVPVIMVTSWRDLDSRVRGLNMGADDYLLKPFNLAELIARIHAVTRRGEIAAKPPGRRPEPAADGVLVLGPLRIDLDARAVTVDGRRVPLSRKEHDLLVLLARRSGVVFRREHILADVWHGSPNCGGHTLEVHMAALRQKLGVPGLITTVRGVGYRLDVPATGTE
ncbi:response regulator transcription factor [Planosporangium mesophilum]|uniref:Sensory transduction protein RegX3 n=1 Tax=Planosporangium mesophilum TaxID=689768 RepID=A0A8J3TKF2_9ACTN|nr:response regulator transcription factor [Planosporangium mesophilum]NJC86567.1 response regulator transcription factor [Planosporangium mesophilum]GII26234.1 DNA-binding response regulator [Planosporangium mesophilum]